MEERKENSELQLGRSRAVLGASSTRAFCCLQPVGRALFGSGTCTNKHGAGVCVCVYECAFLSFFLMVFFEGGLQQ